MAHDSTRKTEALSKTSVPFHYQAPSVEKNFFLWSCISNFMAVSPRIEPSRCTFAASACHKSFAASVFCRNRHDSRDVSPLPKWSCNLFLHCRDGVLTCTHMVLFLSHCLYCDFERIPSVVLICWKKGAVRNPGSHVLGSQGMFPSSGPRTWAVVWITDLP